MHLKIKHIKREEKKKRKINNTSGINCIMLSFIISFNFLSFIMHLLYIYFVFFYRCKVKFH